MVGNGSQLDSKSLLKHQVQPPFEQRSNGQDPRFHLLSIARGFPGVPQTIRHPRPLSADDLPVPDPRPRCQQPETRSAYPFPKNPIWPQVYENLDAYLVLLFISAVSISSGALPFLPSCEQTLTRRECLLRRNQGYLRQAVLESAPCSKSRSSKTIRPPAINSKDGFWPPGPGSRSSSGSPARRQKRLSPVRTTTW